MSKRWSSAVLNETEKLQIDLHRNDKWQDRVEGGFPSVAHVGPSMNSHNGRVLISRRKISAGNRRLTKNLRKVLEAK